MVTATVLPEGITRADLARAFNNDDRFVRAFEKILLTVASNSGISKSTADATTELQDATAVTLSPNAALNNERVLEVTAPLALEDNGPNSTVIIGFSFALTVNDAGHALIVNLLGDTNITLPPTGRLLASDITNAVYANDAAAGAAGLVIGEAYRTTGGAVVWKQV